jgi:hypothetical protein
VIRPEPGEWHPRMPERLDEEELADWRARGLSARGPDRGRAPRGRTHEPSIRALLYGDLRRQSAALRKEHPGGGRPGLSRGRVRGKNSLVQKLSNSITQ